MITDDQEAYILSNAYVTEHIVSLMVLISKAEPFLISNCLCYVKNDWLIIIGYPLEGEFAVDRFSTLVQEATAQFDPQSVWMAAPDIPDHYLKSGNEVERDVYYRLDLDGFKPRARLVREVNKAMQELTVERTKDFTKEHKGMVEEFIKREKPGPRVKELYLSMEGYTSKSRTALLLNARDKKGHLSAFYAIELGAKEFAAYVIGCHSKKNYVSHASDLLFYEMVRTAGEFRKKHINLGLGVNEGIKRFKEKWGGTPCLKYTFCDYQTGRRNLKGSFTSIIDAMKGL